MLNTVSTITDPVTRNANVGPRVVTTGISEFFSTCLITTRRSGRPLAHAVGTKSCRSVSSVLAQRRQDSEADPDGDDQKEGQDPDRGGVRPALEQQVGHRLALVLVREPE